MEEETQQSGGKNWIIWALVPVCVVCTILVTRMFFRSPAPQPDQAGEYSADGSGGSPGPGGIARPMFQDTPIVQEYRPQSVQGAASGQNREMSINGIQGIDEGRGAASVPGQAPVPQQASDKKLFNFSYPNLAGALLKAANNPKVIGAVLNNDFVVKGFMSLPRVKAATASKEAMIAYFKDPRNINEWVKIPSVKAAYDNPEVFATASESKLLMELVSTPAANQLLGDPKAINDILEANPGLVQFLTDPKFINAVANNSKTAGALSRLNMGGQ
jgi:hypothetical protein